MFKIIKIALKYGGVLLKIDEALKDKVVTTDEIVDIVSEYLKAKFGVEVV